MLHVKIIYREPLKGVNNINFDLIGSTIGGRLSEKAKERILHQLEVWKAYGLVGDVEIKEIPGQDYGFVINHGEAEFICQLI